MLSFSRNQSPEVHTPYQTKENSMVRATRRPHPAALVLCLALLLLLPASSSLAADAKAPAEPILVFGHKNPDTDSIAGAIAAAYLLEKTGRPALPMAQGAPNPETAFVLKKFGLKAPAALGPVAGKPVGIVDFNDAAQGPDDLKDARLVFIADHHKLGGLSTPAPLEAWLLPLGSANTVLYEMFQHYKVAVPKDIAGGMLCGILSDTVIFRSATTTERDKEAAKALAKTAGVADTKALGVELFKIKSAIDGTPAKELVLRDYKDFVMSGTKVGVGQLELVDLSLVKNAKKDLLAAMKQVKDEKGAHSIFLMLTDIMREGTELLFVTDDPAVVKAAFKTEPKGSEVWLPGVMSRKKQIIPNLEAVFKK